MLLRGLAGAICTLLSYAILTTGAIGPAHGSIADLPDIRDVPRASLVQAGGDLFITGSVGHMFETGSFAGPNRAEKQDRLRPLPDVVSVASGFEAIRARLAALRAPRPATTATPDAAAAIAASTPAAPVEIASLSPELASSALDAIDDVASAGPDAPMPRTLSQQIAYARADADLAR